MYGLVQGLTEFLPVSSSGHLVVAQEFFGIEPKGILLEITLHIATLLAVVIFLRKHLLNLLGKLFSRDDAGYGWMYILGILIASIPAGIVGLFFEERIESLFENVLVVGIFLLITGAVVVLMPRLYREETKSFNWKNVVIISLIVGVFQAFAIMPGISRSGFTIFAGLLVGLSWKESANFSFTISIPAILGAGLLEMLKIAKVGFQGELILLISGFLSALISGILALWLLYKVLDSGKINYFGYYCLIAGLVVIIYWVL